MSTRIVGSSKVFAVGLVDQRIVVSVWRGPPTIREAEMQRAAIGDVVRLSPKTCAFVCCVEQSSPKPPPDVQKDVTETFMRAGLDLGAVAYVVEGSSLRSAFVRSIMTGLTIVKGTSQPQKYFPNVENAESWVHQTVALPEPFRLREAVEQVRRAIQSPVG